MSVVLTKGGNVNLSKENPGLAKVSVGLGWDTRVTDGQDFDLDAVLYMVGENGKVASDKDFIFYGNLKSPDGSIVHTGDNLTGEGEGDDESINVDLSMVPASVTRLVIGVTIYGAKSKGQNFGQVSNAFVRIVDAANGTELVRYDLGEDYSMETAMTFGELYRNGGDWKFKAIGAGFNGGLGDLSQQFGVSV